MFPPATLTPLIERLASILGRVMQALGSRCSPPRHSWRPDTRKLLPHRLVARVNMWLQARRGMILALIDRIAAGTHRASSYKPRAPNSDATPRPPALPPAEAPLPRGYGWISGMTWEVGAHAAELIGLLDEPEMRAMALASPQMVRLWLPLLHALGLPRPEWMPPLPRAGRTPKPRIRKPFVCPPEPSAPPPTRPPPTQDYAPRHLWFANGVTRKGDLPLGWSRGPPPGGEKPIS